jgi:hypothetical protein
MRFGQCTPWHNCLVCDLFYVKEQTEYCDIWTIDNVLPRTMTGNSIRKFCVGFCRSEWKCVFGVICNIKTTVIMQKIVSGCALTKSHTRYPLKCFHRPQLIRECNITGLVSYINPLIERACLSLEDHNLIAYNGYYNVFCHMCNTNEKWGTLYSTILLLFLLVIV